MYFQWQNPENVICHIRCITSPKLQQMYLFTEEKYEKLTWCYLKSNFNQITGLEKAMGCFTSYLTK